MQFKFHTRKEHHFIDNKQLKKKNNSNKKSTNLHLTLITNTLLSNKLAFFYQEGKARGWETCCTLDAAKKPRLNHVTSLKTDTLSLTKVIRPFSVRELHFLLAQQEIIRL